MVAKYLVDHEEFVSVADVLRDACGIEGPIVWPEEWKTAIQGVNGIDFSIVRGESAPEEISENTIWIQSGEDITKWIISNVQPLDTTEGCLWIWTREDGSAPLNVLKDF